MSFTAPPQQRSQAPFPLASMIDIMFLLLIFFMTTSVFREYDQQIDVSLPATQTGHATGSPRQVVITITDKDEIFLSGRRYTLDELRATLTELARLEAQTVVIRADAASRWNTGVGVMDAARAAGMTDVAVSTIRSRTQATE